EGWIEFREAARQRFAEIAVRGRESEKEEPSHAPERQAIICLLKKSLSAGQNPDMLWSFIRKYEVFGRFFSHYTPDLRRHTDALPADLEAYILFAECLVAYAEGEEELQYQSTLCKVLDALCSYPAEKLDCMSAD